MKHLDELTHFHNPLHYYCRLRERNFEKVDARNIAEYYEKTWYKTFIITSKLDTFLYEKVSLTEK